MAGRFSPVRRLPTTASGGTAPGTAEETDACASNGEGRTHHSDGGHRHPTLNLCDTATAPSSSAMAAAEASRGEWLSSRRGRPRTIRGARMFGAASRAQWAAVGRAVCACARAVVSAYARGAVRRGGATARAASSGGKARHAPKRSRRKGSRSVRTSELAAPSMENTGVLPLEKVWSGQQGHHHELGRQGPRAGTFRRNDCHPPRPNQRARAAARAPTVQRPLSSGLRKYTASTREAHPSQSSSERLKLRRETKRVFDSQAGGGPASL